MPLIPDGHANDLLGALFIRIGLDELNSAAHVKMHAQLHADLLRAVIFKHLGPAAESQLRVHRDAPADVHVAIGNRPKHHFIALAAELRRAAAHKLKRIVDVKMPAAVIEIISAVGDAAVVLHIPADALLIAQHNRQGDGLPHVWRGRFGEGRATDNPNSQPHRATQPQGTKSFYHQASVDKDNPARCGQYTRFQMSFD